MEVVVNSDMSVIREVIGDYLNNLVKDGFNRGIVSASGCNNRDAIVVNEKYNKIHNKNVIRDILNGTNIGLNKRYKYIVLVIENFVTTYDLVTYDTIIIDL